MIPRDVIYDINALQQNVSVDKYFGSANEQSTPSFKNNFTDAVSPESMQDGKLLADISSADYAAGLSGWIIKANGDVEFNDGDFRGNVEVGSIDIGGSDSTSAHIDSDGNFWLGAATYATAPAKISKEGYAVFENVAIGGDTIQYVITNSGIFSFGDGSDGDAVCDGSTSVTGMSRSGSTYTMTRDVYFDDLTINASVIVNMNGYRVFVRDTLTVNGLIHRNGNAGGNASGTTGGSGGAALADGYLKGSLAGATGGNGANGGSSTSDNPTAGGNGANLTNSIGSNGLAGVAGGNGGGGGSPITGSGVGCAGIGIGGSAGKNGASGGTAGTVTQSNVKLIANWHLATLLDISSTGATVKFTPSASSGASGGGGNGGGAPDTCNSQNYGSGGGAGGTGSAGGIAAIYARNIIIGAAGAIEAKGGAGGNGADGTNGSGSWAIAGGGGGGGGGIGGNGGVLVLAYNSLTNNGSISVAGGTAGTAGTGGTGYNGASAGSSGTAGIAGSAGVLYQFELSL